MSWGGSLLLHATLLVIAMRCRPQRSPVPTATGTGAEVELVGVVPATMAAPAPAPQPARPSTQVAPGHAAGHAGAGAAGGHRARGGREPGGSAIAGVEREGGRAGTGTGGAGSRGAGMGGIEAAGALVPWPPPAALALAPAQPRSSARPARLIWPTRRRDERPGHVFLMRLTVDEDGSVVGVRQLRGIGGRDDERAQAAVWSFRYDPARDEAGRPVTSRVDQRFMLDD